MEISAILDLMYKKEIKGEKMNTIKVTYDEENRILETEIKKDKNPYAFITMSSIPYQENTFENRIEITTYPKEDSYLETDQEIDKKQQELVTKIKQEILQKTISINPILTRQNPIDEMEQAIYGTDSINNRNYVQELLTYYQQKEIPKKKGNLIEGEKKYGK